MACSAQATWRVGSAPCTLVLRALAPAEDDVVVLYALKVAARPQHTPTHTHTPTPHTPHHTPTARPHRAPTLHTQTTRPHDTPTPHTPHHTPTPRAHTTHPLHTPTPHSTLHAHTTRIDHLTIHLSPVAHVVSHLSHVVLVASFPLKYSIAHDEILENIAASSPAACPVLCGPDGVRATWALLATPRSPPVRRAAAATLAQLTRADTQNVVVRGRVFAAR